MNCNIPEAVRPTLCEYTALVDEWTPGLLDAFYLEGSIALGGFNPLFSDIDYAAILAHPPSTGEIEQLASIHQLIESRHPRWKMQGSYIQTDELARQGTRKKRALSYDDGALRRDGCFMLDSVEGWIVKNHGIALLGPEAQTLPYTVDWPALIGWMKENLNTYWAGWAKRPGRLVMMLSEWGTQWAVLGVLRQYYTFEVQSITTKEGAGLYGLAHLPPCWHGIVREALNIREGKTSSAYGLRVTRTLEVIRFLKYIIQTCNTKFAHG